MFEFFSKKEINLKVIRNIIHNKIKILDSWDSESADYEADGLRYYDNHMKIFQEKIEARIKKLENGCGYSEYSFHFICGNKLDGGLTLYCEKCSVEMKTLKEVLGK